MKRLAWLALGVAGCGLSVAGTGSLDDGSPSVSGADAASDGAPPGDGAAPNVVNGDGSSAPDVTDAVAPPPDARTDAPPPPPDPTKVALSYAIGKDSKVYRFDIVTSTFSVYASNGCPSGEESAVLTDGSIFVTSSDNRELYRVTPGGCALVKGNSSFPYALGTAPVGTLSATKETLVGYAGADYVRVDDANGNVAVIAAGALGSLRPAGDVTAIGARGYLAALTGSGSGAFACPSGGDCIVEVDLTTGAPVALVAQLPGLGIYGLAHSWGNLLLYANGKVFPYDPVGKTLGVALANMPAGANFSGAGAAPFPNN